MTANQVVLDLSNYYFSKNALIRKEHFGTLVLLRNGRRFEVPNRLFPVLKSLADHMPLTVLAKERTHLPLVGGQCSPGETSAPLSRDEVAFFVQSLLERRVLTTDASESENVSVVEGEYISDDCLTFPRTVYWECTRKCNLACTHCYTDSGFSNHEPDLPFETVRDMVDELADHGVEFFSIGGGEPLLYKDLFRVLEHCRERGVSVEVTTNGSLANASMIERLKDAGLEYVQLSLDGASKETYENVRLRSDFDRVIRHGYLLADAFHLAVCTVVVRQNLHEIAGVIEWAKKFGAEYYRVIPLMPVGRGANEGLAIGTAEMAELNQLMLERSRTEKEIVVQLNENIILPTRKNVTWMPDQHYGCPAGRTTVGIDAYGNVYPCAYMHHDALIAGNLTDRSLLDIWRDSALMDDIRTVEKLEGACGTCQYVETCRGGCRAAAFLKHESLAASDPLCAISQP